MGFVIWRINVLADFSLHQKERELKFAKTGESNVLACFCYLEFVIWSLFEVWSLRFVIYLLFGVWRLGFVIYLLFDIWNL